jgi:uncharacterized protein YcfJ
MKRVTLQAVALTLAGTAAIGQAPPTQPAPAQKSLASQVGVYVYPQNGQKSDRQGVDEADCYKWAVKSTGIDPFEVQKQAEYGMQVAAAHQAAAPTAAEGARARGAVGGAVVGGLIGGISGHGGEGAAAGAAVGILAGGARRREARRQAEAQAEATAQQTQAVSGAQMDSFRKAFSVCLEGRHYLAKY